MQPWPRALRQYALFSPVAASGIKTNLVAKFLELPSRPALLRVVFPLFVAAPLVALVLPPVIDSRLWRRCLCPPTDVMLELDGTLPRLPCDECADDYCTRYRSLDAYRSWRNVLGLVFSEAGILHGTEMHSGFVRQKLSVDRSK